MEACWLHKYNRHNLIVFCSGWGMDRFPFQFLSSADYDVYMLYNYCDLAGAPDLERIAVQYRQVILVGWSMGVWVGQKLFADKKHLLQRTIAINGTLCPIDDACGIPAQVFDATLMDFNDSTRLKFYKRMCRQKPGYQSFLATQPQRSVEDQAAELAALKKMADCLPSERSLYDEIIVADKDFIVPTANQLHFWQTRHVTSVAGFHFLFTLWSSWEQLLGCTGISPVVKR